MNQEVDPKDSVVGHKHWTIFTVRLFEAYTHGIAVEILSVCPSVCPSVKRMYCDKTKAPSEKKFNYD